MVPVQKHSIEANIYSFSVKDLDQLIETNLKDGNKYSKLLIGYKLFSDLMNDPIFYTEVSNSALSATKRKYKQLKIKITTHQYQLHFE
nr:hypothetical protein [Acinetobacter baumannii]